jgi:hypothetical protein
MTQDGIRHYVALKLNSEVRERYFDRDRNAAADWSTSYIARHVFDRKMTEPPFQTVGMPSNDVQAVFGTPMRKYEQIKEIEPDEVLVALTILDSKKLSCAEIVDTIIKATEEKQDIFAGSSPDLAFVGADHWCGEGSDAIFSKRSRAERLHGIDYLRMQSNTTGHNVNVVIVDQGLDQSALGSSYGGGWQVGNSMPGAPPSPPPGSVRRSHGMMIAHNIRKVAPDAKLFDVPLVPPQVTLNHAFLSLADAAYQKILADIALWRLGSGPLSGAWILVNPWGIFDRKSEVPRGYYTENPHNHFNRLVVRAVQENIDVVFAAGNCGQFCPDHRCGASDRGPGYSIWGANSLDPVVTVGAVRTDGMWVGYSSQGPGQSRLGTQKPDFCAASQFTENDDAFSINTGTSAACGLTCGVVAALRSRWDQNKVSPGQLKSILNNTARKPRGLSWNNPLGHRFGNGILDARAAFDQLQAQFP